ncbi:CBS domain-containing protein [Actinoplanes sp. TBRC 11911]|nr:CBS domain-containing protein [Actinoplanes sp. TBRC 11911]
MKNWTVNDVMTTEVVSVDETTSYRNIVDLLMERHVSAVPVIDKFGRVVGMVSEADLLRKIEYAGDEEPRMFESRRHRGERAKATSRTAADLMTAPAIEALSGTSIGAAARRMDRENVKRLPVTDALGRLVGIVTRGDLLKVHLRSDEEILADIEDGVLKPYLVDEANTIAVAVDDGVVTLSGNVDRWSSADLAARLIRQLPGVVDVTSTVGFAFDDRNLLTPGFFGVA